jgi:L-amino acid N-acyltransferase
MTIQLSPCTEALHAPAILGILNHAIVTSTALYDYQPRTLANMATWFAAKRAGDFPVIGAFDVGLEAGDERGEISGESGGGGEAPAKPTLLGFASFGAFRAFPAYKYTVEHSVYVHHAHRGRGLAKVLMNALIDAAQQQGKHVMVGAIDAANEVSLKLHADLGFQRVGTMPQVGFKFGRWLDLVLVQRVLTTPNTPVDG